MTVDEDGVPALETSEPSNVTSLATDTCSIINSSEVSDNATRQRVDPNNECRYETTKKSAALPTAARNAALTNPGQPSSVSHQPQRTPHQPVAAQFEPVIQCLCHGYRLKQFALPEKYCQRSSERFNWKWPKKEYARKKNKLYEVKVKRNHYRHYSKPSLEDTGTEGIPRKKNSEFEKSEEPKKYTEAKRELEEISERIDIYYFDHGNSAYYRTTDSPPVLATEKCAERTDHAATRFWAEIFGTVHIGVSFVIAFVLQLLRFLLYSIVRPLTVGTLQLLADYFVKPLLSIFFNALVQPILILLYNVATSLRDLCEPMAEALGFFLREFATLIRAFRLVEMSRVEAAAPTQATRLEDTGDKYWKEKLSTCS